MWSSHPSNCTWSSGTVAQESVGARHLSSWAQAGLTGFYLSGVAGNVCSLLLLSRSAPNKKHGLMLSCLAANDLVALAGSLILMYARLYLWPSWVATAWFCALRVLLRTFGLSSGCVATVMAVERFLAFTRPFLYHQYVTYRLIKRTILGLWFLALMLVCLPFFGFGLYYDRRACVRYRFAQSAKDIAYAYLVFAFGLTLCVVIVGCNLAVVRVLGKLGKKKKSVGRTVVRKKSNELAFNLATAEEIAFAKLMVVLCIFFVVCWVPQMITIVIAQTHPGMKDHPFYRLADVFMATNFILDPVVYVLSRRPHRKGLKKLLEPVCRFCFPKAYGISSVQISSADQAAGDAV